MDHRTWTAHKNLPMQLWDQCVKFQKPMQKRLQPAARCADMRPQLPARARRNQQLPRVKRRQNGGKWREWEASCAYSLTGCRAALASVFVFPPVSSVVSSESVLRAQDAHSCVSDMRDPAYFVSKAWTHLETAQNRPFRVCCLRADLLEAVGLARKRGGSGWAERAVGRHFRDSHPMLAFGLFTFCIYN